jgi:hypothetical protein
VSQTVSGRVMPIITVGSVDDVRNFYVETLGFEHVNLTWSPHVKSMSLGQLALHVATLPGQLTEFVAGDELDFSAAAAGPPTVGGQRELLEAFTSSIERARSYLSS